MVQKLNKKQNMSINIFRYFCAILVVAVHTSPFYDVNDTLGYIFTQMLPRIAVPFFFAVSGYFYTSKLEKGQKVFWSYFKRILIVYSIWSLVYILISFLQWGNTNIIDFIKYCVIGYFINGTYYHFWFFPALIFSVCVTTLLFKIKCSKVIIPLSIILYILGCLGCSYYYLGIKIPLLGNLFVHEHFLLIRRVLLMAFPFFISGYLIHKIKSKFSQLTQIKWMMALAVIAVVWLSEIVLVVKLRIQTNIFLTLGLYLLVVAVLSFLLLKDPLAKFIKLSEAGKTMANFIYYSHPAFIVVVNLIMNNVFQKNLYQTPRFLLTVLITSVIGFLIYKSNNKFLKFIVK